MKDLLKSIFDFKNNYKYKKLQNNTQEVIIEMVFQLGIKKVLKFKKFTVLLILGFEKKESAEKAQGFSVLIILAGIIEKGSLNKSISLLASFSICSGRLSFKIRSFGEYICSPISILELFIE